MSLLTSFFLVSNLTCPAPITDNVSGFPWNDRDTKILEITKTRCAVKYKRSPCLIKFQKYGESDYRVICGAKR